MECVLHRLLEDCHHAQPAYTNKCLKLGVVGSPVFCGLVNGCENSNAVLVKSDVLIEANPNVQSGQNGCGNLDQNVYVHQKNHETFAKTQSVHISNRQRNLAKKRIPIKPKMFTYSVVSASSSSLYPRKGRQHLTPKNLWRCAHHYNGRVTHLREVTSLKHTLRT